MDARQALIDRQRSDAPGIYGANSKDAAEIRRAFDLYAAADLTLPSLRIYVHSTNEGCNENDGLFNKDYTGHRIDVCDVRVLVHELAHAWEHNHMDETGRQAFMDYAGLEVWSDYDTRYAQRGVEQVAEVIASGVRDGQVSVEHLDLYHEHIHRYRMLTGKPSPRIAEAIGEMRRNRI